MYKIIGADQKQYGPISGDQIRQWISEGRVNGQTVACAEGTEDWKPLAQFPEFGFTAAPAAAAKPPAYAGAPMTREEIVARDYSLDLMSCFSRGWMLYKENFGTMFVTFLLFIVLLFAAGLIVQAALMVVGVNHLPITKQLYFRPIYIIFSSLVAGPAAGGLFYVFLSLLRGQPASAGELFTGFNSFQDLFLARLITSLIGGVCTFPFVWSTSAKLAPFLERMQQNPPAVNPHEMLSTFVSAYSSALPLLLVGLIPATYFFVSLYFTVPLIIDKQMGLWTAMCTCWKMVHKHWFHIFGLVVLASLVNIPGFCVCVIGILFTAPLGLAAVCYAYEDIFGRQNT
jgi:GYF domain 2